MKIVMPFGTSVLWRFLLLLAIPNLASAQSDLQIIVGPPLGAGAIPDAPPLPDVAAQPVTFGGINSTACDMLNVDTIMVRSPDLTEKELVYKVQYVDSNFWFGMEAGLAIGGSASFYVSTYDDAPGICFIAGRLSSVKAGINIVFRTRPDGSIWAQLLTNEELAEIKVGDVEYHGQASAETDEIALDVLGPDSGQVIDIMIPYTQEAMCSEAFLFFPCDFTQKENYVPIQNRINFLLMESKMTFLNTGLQMSLQLVHSYMVTDFVESGMGNFDTEFTQIFTEGDGIFEGLQDLRDEYCADIVHLLVSQAWDLGGGFGLFGRVSEIGPDANNYALFTSLEQNSFHDFVFTHETGHMLVSPSLSYVFTQKGMTLIPFHLYHSTVNFIYRAADIKMMAVAMNAGILIHQRLLRMVRLWSQLYPGLVTVHVGDFKFSQLRLHLSSWEMLLVTQQVQTVRERSQKLSRLSQTTETRVSARCVA